MKWTLQDIILILWDSIVDLSNWAKFLCEDKALNNQVFQILGIISVKYVTNHSVWVKCPLSTKYV